MLNIETFTKQALLITLTVRCWFGRKQDKSVESYVNHEYNASDAGNYHKKLIDRKALSNITSILSKMKTYHYENTAPWGSGSARVIPAANFLDYARKVGEFNTELQYEVENLIDNYKNVINEARVRLGNLFNPSDYPEPEELRKKYAISFETLPFTSTKDIRLDLMDEEVQLIKDGYIAQLNIIANETTQSVIQDIVRELGLHIDKLTDGTNLRSNSFSSIVKLLKGKLELVEKVLKHDSLGYTLSEILANIENLDINQLKRSRDFKDNVILDLGRYQSKLERELALLQQERDNV